YITYGGSTAFGKWTPGGPTGSWTAMAVGPANFAAGAALASDGTNIYALTGNNTKTFSRYNVALNTWTALTQAPGAFGAGAGLVYAGGNLSATPGHKQGGGNLYATRGNKQWGMYRYNIAAGTWTPMANAPSTLNLGSALATDGTSIW